MTMIINGDSKWERSTIPRAEVGDEYSKLIWPGISGMLNDMQIFDHLPPIQLFFFLCDQTVFIARKITVK